MADRARARVRNKAECSVAIQRNLTEKDHPSLVCKGPGTRGATPVIFGDGKQTRDYVYVSDVIEANLRAALTPAVAGRVFNIATGTACTLNILLGTLY